MSIDFQCQNCGQSYTAPATAVGKQTRCKKCGQVVIVPALQSAPSPPQDQPFRSDVKTPPIAEAVSMGLASMLDDDLPSLEPLPPAPARPAAALGGLGSPSGTGGIALPAPRVSRAPLSPAVMVGLAIAGAVLVFGVGLIFILAFALRGTRNSVPPSQPVAAVKAIPPRAIEKPQRIAAMPSLEEASPATPDHKAAPLPASATVRKDRGRVQPLRRGTISNGDNGEAVEEETDVPWTAASDDAQATPWKVARKWETSFSSSADVIAPAVWSQFVLVKEHERGQTMYGVIDLATGKIVTTRRGEMKMSSPALSPSGRYVAASPSYGSKSRSVAVYALTPKEKDQNLEPNDAAPVSDLVWSGDDRLWTLQESKDQKKIFVCGWDVQNGQPACELEIPLAAGQRYRRDSLTPSPLGHSLCLVVGDRLCVYDSETGSLAGVLEPPKGMNVKDDLIPGGLSFSPAGDRLAAICRTPSSGAIFTIWDFSTGESILTHEFEEKQISLRNSPRMEQPQLVWLPDGGWVLQGRYLLDGQSGAFAWQLPGEEYSHKPRLLADARHRLVFKQARGQLLTVEPLPEKEIAAALDFTRQGGAQVDFGRPKLTEVSLEGVRKIEIPEGNIPWQVEADPRRSARPKLTGMVALQGVEQLPGNALFPRSDNRLILECGRHRRVAGKKGVEGDKAAGGLLLKRIVVGNSVGTDLQLDPDHRILSVAPGGDRVLVQREHKQGEDLRLEVWTITRHEHVASWRPYEDAKKFESHVSAEFVDDNHVLTTSYKDGSVLWRLPDCKPLYAISSALTPMAVSPGGKYLVFWTHGEQRALLLETAAGEFRGIIDPPTKMPNTHVAAYRPDGRALALISTQQFTMQVGVWNLENGSQTSDFETLLVMAQPLEFVDDRFLLGAGQFLIDLKRESVVWKYGPSHARLVRNSGDGKLWMIGQDPRGQAKGVRLAAAPLASAEMRRLAETKNLKDFQLLGPGDKATLQVSVSLPNVDSALLEKGLRESLLVRNQVTIADAAPVHITVTGSSHNTGKTLDYRELHSIRKPVVSVAVEQADVTITVKDDKGRTWSSSRSASTQGGSIEYGDVGSRLPANFRQVAGGLANDLKLPHHVYPNDVFDQLGTSTLTVRGELWPPRKP